MRKGDGHVVRHLSRAQSTMSDPTLPKQIAAALAVAAELDLRRRIWTTDELRQELSDASQSGPS